MIGKREIIRNVKVEQDHMDASSESMQNILLAEILDISSAAELKAGFLLCLENNIPVCVDAKNVERADTAALQVIAAFIQDAKNQGQSVHWHEPSDVLIQSAGLLGLRDFLGLGGQSAQANTE